MNPNVRFITPNTNITKYCQELYTQLPKKTENFLGSSEVKDFEELQKEYRPLLRITKDYIGSNTNKDILYICLEIYQVMQIPI